MRTLKCFVAIFKKEKINKRDFQTYTKLYHTMKEALEPRSNGYLKCSVKAIKESNEVMKVATDSNQLHSQFINYVNWIIRYDLSPVLGDDRMDYISDLAYRIRPCIRRLMTSSSLKMIRPALPSMLTNDHPSWLKTWETGYGRLSFSQQSQHHKREHRPIP